MVDNEMKVETNSTLLLENYLSFELENICKRRWAIICSLKTISLLNLKIFVREDGLSFILFFFSFFHLDTCPFFFHIFSFFLLHSHMFFVATKIERQQQEFGAII
jgi:uncharacterized protein YqjF (DUF2071 family)